MSQGPVLVLGAGGRLGRAALEGLRRRGREAVGLTRAELDVTDADAVDAVFARRRPAAVINAAAYTAVDRAESEPAKAQAANAVAPGLIADVARRSGARMIHLSTDYVFDGLKQAPYVEGDAAAPLSVYGRSKRAGEQAVLASGVVGAVVRTSWLLSAGGFTHAMLSRAQAGVPLQVVSDQIGRPTLLSDLAEAVVTLALSPRASAASSGARLYHFAGPHDASWFEVAQVLTEAWAEAVGASPPALSPVAAATWRAPAPRPADSRLDSGRIAAELGLQGGDWRQAAPELVQQWLAETRA